MESNNEEPILDMEDFSKELHRELVYVGRRKLDEVLKRHGYDDNKALSDTMMGGNSYFLRIISKMFADIDLLLNNNEKRKDLINDLFRPA